MSKQRKPRQPTNIRNIMELNNRELCYDTGFDLPPLMFNSQVRSPNMNNVEFRLIRAKPKPQEVEIKTKAKAHMIKYMNTYKDNFELLQYQTEPKFKYRPPLSVLRAMQSLPRNRSVKPQSCPDKEYASDSSEILLSSQRYSTANPSYSSATKKTTRRMPLSEDDYHKYMQGYSLGRLPKAESRRFRDVPESSEKFYDLESSSHCII